MRSKFRCIIILLCFICIVHAIENQGDATSDDTDRAIEISFETITAIIFASAASSVSMAVGVGGGGILVPIFNILLHFSIKQSTALAQSVICCSGLGTVIFSLRNSLPSNPNKPLADIHTALLLTPPLLFGVSIGVLANRLLPPYIISLTIIIILSYISYRTFLTATKLSQREKEDSTTEQTELSQHEISTVPSHTVPLIPWSKLCQLLLLWIIFSSLQYGKSKFEICSVGYLIFFSAQALFAIAWVAVSLAWQKRSTASPVADNGRSKNLVTVYNASTVTVSADPASTLRSFRLFQHHDSYSSSSTPLDPLERPLLLDYEYDDNTDEHHGDAPVLLDIVDSSWAGRRNDDSISTLDAHPSMALPPAQQHHTNSINQLIASEYDSASWSLRKLVSILAFIATAGALAGIIGMGGGFILNPLLLELGVHPLVSSATSGLMVLFASSSATFSFVVDGRLNVHYAAVFGTACGVSSFFGVVLLSKAVAKKGSSVLVYTLACVLAIGAISTLIFHGRHIIEEIIHHHHHQDGGFHAMSSVWRDFCGISISNSELFIFF